MQPEFTGKSDIRLRCSRREVGAANSKAIVTNASSDASRSLRILGRQQDAALWCRNSVMGVPYANTARMPDCLERIDGGVGMGRRIDDVAPVEQRRNARIDLIEGAYQIADVNVLRRVELDDLANQHAKIVVERPVRGDAAQRGLPEMDVAVDKARHGDHATAVDLA